MLLWTFTYRFLCGHMLSSLLGYIPRRGIAGLYCNSILNLLKNCQTVFPRGCFIVHFPRAMYGSSDFSMSMSTLVVFWCELVSQVLLCIFLMTNDVGHLFMCFRMNFCKNVIPVISLLKTFPKLHHCPWNKYQTPFIAPKAGQDRVSGSISGLFASSSTALC